MERFSSINVEKELMELEKKQLMQTYLKNMQISSTKSNEEFRLLKEEVFGDP